MAWVRTVSLVSLAVVMVGCATATKPVLSESGYKETAREWHAIHRCTFDGYINPETAALGKLYIQNALSAHQVDSPRLDAEVAQLNQDRVLPSKNDCNTLAMNILAAKKRIEAHNENVEYQQRAANELANGLKNIGPRQTYCTHTGIQTLCNTY